MFMRERIFYERMMGLGYPTEASLPIGCSLIFVAWEVLVNMGIQSVDIVS